MARVCYITFVGKIINLKKGRFVATVNDIVLIYLENAPVSFARIESIEPDVKKDWYHIRLLMLQIPLQMATWILKNDYINGHEFSMNGKKMRLEKIEAPPEDLPSSRSGSGDGQTSDKTADKKSKDPGKIISFSDFKKS